MPLIWHSAAPADQAASGEQADAKGEKLIKKLIMETLQAAERSD